MIGKFVLLIGVGTSGDEKEIIRNVLMISKKLENAI